MGKTFLGRSHFAFLRFCEVIEYHLSFLHQEVLFMKRDWSADDLAEHWTLLPSERELLANKTGATRLGFAVLLKFFQVEARFPRQLQEIPVAAIECIAQQAGVSAAELVQYDLDSRAAKYHRAHIRSLLGFREANAEDSQALTLWLCEQVLAQDRQMERLKAAVLERCRTQHIEPPTPDRVERLIRSALHHFEGKFCEALLARLPIETQAQLNALLLVEPLFAEAGTEPDHAFLYELSADSGPVTLESLRTEIAKLERLRALRLPGDLFAGLSPRIVLSYRQRVSAEESHELRRHPAPLRITLLSAFCHLQAQDITDNLVDLLIETVHRIGAKAERRVERELIEDLKRVSGKHNLLFQLAEAALDHPEGIVKEVVYPVVGEQTLRDLVKEWKANGPVYRHRLRTVMRNSYRAHYRQMLPAILKALEFHSNNDMHRPVIRALELLRKYSETKVRTYPPDEDVPIGGVVRGLWQDAVKEESKHGDLRINRITYEICVLEALRERLRCKEIWVRGANRYRNPDEDLPADFDLRRDEYYQALRLPRDAHSFVGRVQQEMREALETLDRGLPRNQHVKILDKGHGWIVLSPLEAEPEPKGLVALKAEVSHRWPMTSLLDILKETELRVSFTEVFRSPTVYETLDRSRLRERLLLSLHGLGTNTGLKRMAGGQPGITYKDLLYVRRRFITREHLREAIRSVVNATFRVRLSEIWGEATTACASDSKKFAAWDQNLMTEWHVRYGGRGIMIYWHVEKKSACIYSQLKTCSSSEVAAMIEGVLRHCTDIDVQKNYVDSHGQSEVAFAFCHLLGFQLLPRLKAIHSQRLYRPEAGQPDAYPHLQVVLSRPIDWELIEQQYDQMVKYATALRLGTADAEDILRRFTRNNVQHPTYRALAELGKARKTIFLCRYLYLLPLRREIHGGLQVVENWNNGNDFILYGRGGEIATNRVEDQEITMLALHLLQVSLVYINTLMIQRVLNEPPWTDRLTEEDHRALTPLIWNHINPYGEFRLDMNARLAIEKTEAAGA
jgi:TnpA family transposase